MPPHPRLIPQLARRLIRRDAPARPLWRHPGAVVSVALHAALLFALLRWSEPRPMQPPAQPAEVPVVFETMAPRQEEPAPDAESDSAPPGPAGETPTVPPDEQAETPPPLPMPQAEAPAPAPPPEPVPPAPQPQLEPQPELAEPPPPEPPVLAEAPPQAVEPEPEPELPLPPPPVVELAPPTPLRLNPQPPPLPRPAPRRAAPFAGTTDLSQGPPVMLAPQPRRPPPGGGGGGMDLAMGAVPQRSQGPRRPRHTNPLEYVSGVQPNIDWAAALTAWAQRRMYYPPQAGMAGEDGVTVMRMTVHRDGRISGLRVISSSGSRWLDSASLAMFRDAMVPAFTPDMAEEGDSVTLTFRARYNLILR
ncbi:energy transducer TonB [Teichococcus oryzae]|uniref:TonB family protein n=1 Tax=Teichococcus oryzae TaxID=1608942 RepID=A0A5B2TFN0_9PROT|nr:energy transducer TonB [Pseudoroseomonas oryzae]KAA2213281.1 TonB family protein [Pseudoroseomonas oryzae]